MKAVLVTGTGSSIGREVALYFGNEKFRILTHGSGYKDSLKETNKILESRGIDYATYIADFASLPMVEKTCDEILKSESRIDVIVNVAGGANAYGYNKITTQQIVDSVNINLVATMVMTHKLIPLLADKSLIVLTSAMPGIRSGWYPTDACYDAAKGGLMRFGENLARNLAPKTRVNTIIIGLNYVDDNHKAWRTACEKQIPMKRIAYAEDYVKCVQFFWNHEYINGVSLPLDGGWSVFNASPSFSTATDWGKG